MISNAVFKLIKVSNLDKQRTTKSIHLNLAPFIFFTPVELSKHICPHHDPHDNCIECPYNRDPECNCCLYHKPHTPPPAIDHSEIASIIEQCQQRAKQLTGAA